MILKLILGLITVHSILICEAYPNSYYNIDLEDYVDRNPESDMSIQLSECENIPPKQLKSITNSMGVSPVGKFWYRFIKLSESLPTVIFLPGGPGSGSMGHFEGYSSLVKLIDEGSANIILIDPSGVGCNWINPEKNTNAIKKVSTEYTFNQIIAAIRNERLNDYYIYGHSYGTVLGTIVTSKLEKLPDLARPKKIILEGTMGSARTISEDYFGIDQVTNNIIQNDIDLRYLIQNLDKFPVHYPLEFWGSLLGTSSRLLMYPQDRWETKEIGAIFRRNETISSRLLKFLEDRYEFFVNFNFDLKTSLIEDYTYHSIWCTEFSNLGSNRLSISVANGKLVLTEKLNFENPCKNFPYKENFYDSNNFQLSTPIVYIQGDLDTSTPPSSAKYHYDNQLASKEKSFLVIKSDGHLPTSNRLEQCLEKLWQEIFSEINDFNKVLDNSGHCVL